MPRLSLPAPSLLCRLGSLKTANGLPARRPGIRLPNYLIWKALLTRRSSICGSESIFLPAFPVQQGSAGVRRFAEAIGSRSVSLPNQARRPGNSSFGVAAGAVLRDGKLDRVQQILIANRFGQELDRAALHRPNRHRDIGVAADEDNRQAPICLGQLVLKIEPAAAGQPDVENQAPGEVRGALSGALSRNSWTEANDSTRSPTVRRSPRSASRISGSSSMTTTTG